MKLTVSLIALCCTLVLFPACTKTSSNNNNTSNTPAKTKKQLLEAGKWQISAATANATYMGKDSTIDLYGQMDECEKDDFIQFASDGTGTINENIKICPNNQQIANFTWALLNNDTKMSIIDNNPDTVNVAVLTNTQLKITRTSPNSSGTPVTVSRIYKNIK